MKRWTIRGRILGSFAVVLFMMILIAGVAYFCLTRIDQETASLQKDSIPGVYYSTRLVNAVVENYALAEEWLIEAERAGTPELGAKLQASRAALDSMMAEYERTIFQAKDRENFDTVKTLRGLYVTAQEEISRPGSDTKTRDAAMIGSRLLPAFEKLKSATQVLVDFNKANAHDSAQRISEAVEAHPVVPGSSTYRGGGRNLKRGWVSSFRMP
jgi:methyl-accepting chemotaxis protein WspA